MTLQDPNNVVYTFAQQLCKVVRRGVIRNHIDGLTVMTCEGAHDTHLEVTIRLVESAANKEVSA